MSNVTVYSDSMKSNNPEIEKLIDLHGGLEQPTADAVGVTQQCVNKWRSGGAISKEFALKYQDQHPKKISAAKLMGV